MFVCVIWVVYYVYLYVKKNPYNPFWLWCYRFCRRHALGPSGCLQKWLTCVLDPQWKAAAPFSHLYHSVQLLSCRSRLRTSTSFHLKSCHLDHWTTGPSHSELILHMSMISLHCPAPLRSPRSNSWNIAPRMALLVTVPRATCDKLQGWVHWCTNLFQTLFLVSDFAAFTVHIVCDLHSVSLEGWNSLAKKKGWA